MKTTLLASTALVLSVSAAAAADFTMADTGHDHSITLSGDARMGIIHDHVGEGSYETKFTSRARVEFTGAGETDGGLGFGFNFRAGDAAGAASGNNGSVFISQGGHTLAMGDVDSAAKAAVGNVSGVGLTGLEDYNEMFYNLNDFSPALLYSYTGGSLSFHLGLDNSSGGSSIGDAYSLGLGYDAGTYNVAFGFEKYSFDADKWFIGGGADVGAVSLNAIYAVYDDFLGVEPELAVSADFTSGATTFTAFARHLDAGSFPDIDAVGLGVSHDLGGGAEIKAGVVDSSVEGEVIWDFGIAMTF